MKIENLEDLFVHTLQDIYYAENAILKALPKMVEAAESKDLANALDAHLTETKTHVDRLENVFRMLGKNAQGEDCPAIEGILEEAEELMSEIKDADTRDAAMISAAQAVEHYEITRYGTMISWAKLLKNDDVAAVLSETLEEEHAADAKLTEISESKLNVEAA